MLGFFFDLKNIQKMNNGKTLDLYNIKITYKNITISKIIFFKNVLLFYYNGNK